MRLFRYTFLFFLLTFNLISSTPDWYANSDKVDISSKRYLIGFGKALSYEDAVTSAQEDIAGQLGISIETEFTKQEKEAFEKRYAYTEKVSSNKVMSYIKQNLYGYETNRSEKLGDYYYVQGSLHKKRYLKQLISTLENLEDELEDSIEKADNEFENKRFWKALNLYITNNELLIQFHEQLAIYNALSSKPFKVKELPSKYFLKTKIDGLLNSIKISIESGNKQSMTIGSTLQNPVIIKVSYMGLKDETPLPGATVKLSYSNGKLIDIIYTDENGLARFSVLAIPLTSSKNQFKAEFNLADQLEVNYSIKNRYVVHGQYKLENADKPIFYSLDVISKNDSFETEIKDLLNTQLKEFGLIPSKRPQQLHLKAYYVILEEKEVKGPFKIEYLVKSKLIIEMYQTDAFVGQLTFLVDGLGRTNKEAQEKLIQKFIFDAGEFFNLLKKREKVKLEERFHDTARF